MESYKCSILSFLIGLFLIVTVSSIKADQLLQDGDSDDSRQILIDVLGNTDTNNHGGYITFSLNDWLPRLLFGPSSESKRGSLMRFGKRASILRFGKRAHPLGMDNSIQLPLYLQAPIRSHKNLPKSKKAPDSFHWGREAEK